VGDGRGGALFAHEVGGVLVVAFEIARMGGAGITVADRDVAHFHKHVFERGDRYAVRYDPEAEEVAVKVFEENSEHLCVLFWDLQRDLRLDLGHLLDIGAQVGPEVG